MLKLSCEDRAASVIPASLAGSDEVAVVAVCRRGVIRAVNQAFCKRLEYCSPLLLIGKSMRDELLMQRADWAKWKRAAATGEHHDVSFDCRAADDSVVRFRGAIERLPSRHTGEPIVRAVLYDDTAARQLQEVSMRLAEVEALSTLTAGVSHDFKNLLTVLVGNLYLISELVESTSQAHGKIKRARDTAKRGTALANQLLELAVGRQTSAETVRGEPINPRAVILKLVPLLSAAVGSRVMLQTEFSEDVPAVAVNRAEFESAVINLVINARDSFVRQEGVVGISVSTLELAGALAMSLNVSPGTYVETRIQDNGAGIPEELIDKVFRPFFSTKGKGQGCGLGLPMVRWFAERCGGAVRLDSVPGKGTTVRLLLPTQREDLGDTTVQTTPLSALPGGNEAVLVLTDNSDMRTTIREILVSLGYEVVSGDFRATQEILVARSLGAVLIDGSGVSLPAVQHLRRWSERRSSGTGIVVIGDVPRESVFPPTAVRLPKPFGLMELATAVRQAVGDQ